MPEANEETRRTLHVVLDSWIAIRDDMSSHHKFASHPLITGMVEKPSPMAFIRANQEHEKKLYNWGEFADPAEIAVICQFIRGDSTYIQNLWELSEKRMEAFEQLIFGLNTARDYYFRDAT